MTKVVESTPSDSSVSLVKRLIDHFRVAFGFMMILGLILVWVFSNAYLKYQNKRQFDEYVEILTQTLAPPLEFFDLADIDTTIKNYSELLKFRKIRVLDRYNYVQADIGEKLSEVKADFKTIIKSPEGNSLGTLEIWRKRSSAFPIGLGMFLGAGTIQMLTILLLGAIFINAILKKELVNPLRSLAEDIADDKLHAHYIPSPDVVIRTELNNLSNAYAAARTHSKNLLEERDSLHSHLTSENEKRMLQVRIIEETLRQSKMALCYLSTQDDNEQLFFEGWAPVEVRELMASLARKRENLSILSKKYKFDIHNLLHDDMAEITSWEAHFSSGAIWLIRIVKFETDKYGIFASEETVYRGMERALFQKNKLESLGGVSSGVAHDFNNILAIISTALENLSLTVPSNIELRQEAMVAVDRGASIVRQLLQFVNINKTTGETCDLSNLLADLPKTLATMIGPQIKVNVTTKPKLGIKADANLLQTVLINLATNARDAMNKKSCKIEIMTRMATIKELESNLLDRHKNHIALDFQDNGTGIPPEIVDKIFEPFYSTKTAGRGTGLGLSMAYEFMSRIGGALYLSKNTASGACFTIIFQEAVLEDTKASDMVIEENALSDPLSILVIDDEENLTKFIKMFLKERGFEVHTSTSVKDAISILDDAGFDVVLSDMYMPDGTGIEVFEMLNEKHPTTKFILMSGNFQLETVSNDHKTPEIFDNLLFIEKPFQLKSLYNVVTQALA